MLSIEISVLIGAPQDDGKVEGSGEFAVMRTEVE